MCCSFRKLLQNVGKLHVPLGKIEAWLNWVQAAQGTMKLLAEAVRCCSYNLIISYNPCGDPAWMTFGLGVSKYDNIHEYL